MSADRDDEIEVPAWLSAPTIGERIKEIRGDRPRKEFSAQLGIPENTIGNYERDDRPPDVRFLCALIENEGVSIDWLLGGIGEMRRPAPAKGTYGSAERHRVIGSGHEDYVLLPRYDVRATAGHGAFVEQEEIIGHLAFKRQWVRELGVPEDKLALIEIQSDSMEPTIQHGDLVLIDTSVVTALDDGVYVVADGTLKCKRVQRYFDGRVALKSDNPHYDDEILSASEAENLRIIGRLKWFAREL